MGIRTPRTRAAQTEDNGRRLLAAARSVFTRRGYHDTTLDQIAREAGLTKGAVYARFDGKADLMLALLAERIDARIAEMRSLPPPETADDAADAIFRQWLERSRDVGWTLLALEFRVAAARDRKLNARYAQLHRRIIDGVVAHMQRGARAFGRAGVKDAALAAQIGLALSNGLLLERIVVEDAGRFDEAGMEANRVLAAALRADTSVPAARPARRSR